MATVPGSSVKKDPIKVSPKKEVKTAIRPPSFRIEKVTKRQRYLKLLIYGNFGVGKTTLACSALDVPNMCDVVMINAEAGDLSVDEFEGLDAITITNFKALGAINDYLKKHCKYRDLKTKDADVELIKMEAAYRGVSIGDIDEPKRYYTCIIDSLTEVEAYCMYQLLGITESTRIDEEPDSAEWPEFKKNHMMIQRMIRHFRDLPMHVIFTCSEQYDKDEQNRKKFSPDMTGKLTKKIQGFMDMVGYYVQGKDGDKTIRRLLVSPNAKYDAKHRYASFKKDYFLNPTIATILGEVGLLSKEGAELK